MKKYLLVLLPFLLFGKPSAFSQTGKIDSAQFRKLRIDPATARGVPVKELFTSIAYVPLETTKKSQFGEISQLEVVDNKFIIFDFDTWSVLIFSNTGKFINRISARNIATLNGLPAANEGNIFNGFALNKVAGVNYIDIVSKGNILRFTLDGTLSKKFPIGGYRKPFVLKDGTKVIPDYTADQKKYFEFLIVNPKGDSTTYWPYAQDRYAEDDFIIGGNRFDKAANETQLLYYNYYSYDIFSLNGTGVKLNYRVLLPNSIALPPDFSTNSIYKMKKWDFLQKNKNMVYGLRNTWLIGDYLFLTLDALAQQISNKKTLAYNLKSNQVISLQNITPDEISHFLPVNDSSIGTNFLAKGFLTFDGTNLYTAISCVSMAKLKTQIKDSGVDYPMPLKNYFSTDQSVSNPVVVVLTSHISK
ncbi:6-bladed beta-propeller [Mucilaginibacter psychrotolerans]|nr:6-bladed beta-propeller [Mucilaginibacter psychrotolerans]